MDPQQEQALARALELVDAGKPFLMATTDTEGKPQMRWMGALLRDPDCPTVGYMACNRASRKVGQLAANPAVQLLFSSDDLTCVATFMGVGAPEEDVAVRHRVWEAMPMLQRHFSGPDCEELLLIRFEARRVEVLSMKAGPRPIVIDLA